MLQFKPLYTSCNISLYTL